MAVSWDAFEEAPEQPVVAPAPAAPVEQPKGEWGDFDEVSPSRQYSPEAVQAYEETGSVGRSLPGRIYVGMANEGLGTGIIIPALSAAKAVGIPGAEGLLESERHQRDVTREAIALANEQSGYASSVVQQAASGLGTIGFRAAMPGGLMANTAVASGTENLQESNSTTAAIAKTAIELAALKVGPLGKIGQEATGEIASNLTANLVKGAVTQDVIGAAQHAADYLVDVADGKHPYDGAELRSQLLSQVPVNTLMGVGGEAMHEIANRADAAATEIEKAKAAKDAPADFMNPEGKAPEATINPEAKAEKPDVVYVDPAGNPAPKPEEAPPPGGLDLEPTWLDETSPKHAFVDEDRAIMDMVELMRGDTLSFKEAMRLAREQQIPERATEIAAVINTRPDKSATPVEVAGLTIRMQQLKNEYAEADRKADEATNPTDKAAYTLEGERIKAESDILHKAASGSPAGRRLSFQRLVVDRSTELLPVLRRAEVAKGEPLTEPEKESLKKKVQKAQKLKKESEAVPKDVPLGEKDGLLSRVIEDIGAFHTNAIKNKPAEKSEIDNIALELQRLVHGAVRKPEKVKGKERPLTQKERVVELQKRVDALPEGTIDAFDKTNIDRALSRLADYYDSASKNKFLELVAKQKGRKLTPEEEAQFGKFYDEMDSIGRKLASNKLSAEQRQDIEYRQRRLANEVQAEINSKKPKTLFQKVMEPFHLSRALMAAFDLSAVMRQGGFIAFGNPRSAIETFRKTIRKSLASERGADDLQQEIFKRSNAWMYDKGELFLHREDKLSNREEVFLSKWAEKIPFYKASERAYTAFLNRLRADTFDAMVATLAKGGEPTAAELKAIGNYINIATGRGNAYGRDEAMQTMAAMFFAPRYVLSRFQLALGEPLYRGTSRTRKLVAKEYAKYALGASLVYSLSALAWGDKKDFKLGLNKEDVGTPDMGKIRIGPRTLIDPLSGISQTARMLWFTGHGTYATIAGKEQPFGKDALSQAFRFVRTKFAPAPQLVANLMSGKDAIGNPIQFLPHSVHDVLTGRSQTVGAVWPPLSMRDVSAAFKEENVPTATALSALSVLGAGIQIYGPPDEINIVPGRDGISVLDNDGNPAAGPFTDSAQLKTWLMDNGYRMNEQGKFGLDDEAKQIAKKRKDILATRKELKTEALRKLWDAEHGS